MILSPCLAQNSIVFSMTSPLGSSIFALWHRCFEVPQSCCHSYWKIQLSSSWNVHLVELVYALSHTILRILRNQRDKRCSNMLGHSNCFIEVLFYAWSVFSGLIASVRRMHNFAVIFSSQYPRGVLRSLCLKRLRPLIKAITAVI